MRLTAALSIVLLFGVSGCGGGGTVTSDPAPNQQVGPMSVQGAGTVLVPTTTSSGATLYAMTGSITGLQMTDTNPTIPETEVFFVAARGTGYSLMACSPDGSGLRVLTTTLQNIRKMQVFGGYVYYIEADPNTLTYTLKRIKTSGGAVSTIKSNVGMFSSNLNETKIYAHQLPTGTWPNGRMISFNPDGSSTTHMFPTNFSNEGPTFFPGLMADGSLVLVEVKLPSQTLFRSFSPSGVMRWDFNFLDPTEAVGMENGADDVYFRSAGNAYRVAAAGNNEFGLQSLGFPNRGDISIAISPGGTHLAFANPGGGVWIHPPGDTSGQRIYRQKGSAVAWGQYVTLRDFLSGVGFSSAGAFIFSERGSVLPSVVWADATTRNSITLTKISADGSQNVVYRLNCDQLTRMAYSNSLNYFPVNIQGATETGVKGAFISFNSETGKVESITTFKGTVNAVQRVGSVQVTGADTVFRADGSVQRAPDVIEFK